MKIEWKAERRKIADLKPAPYNPRRMTENQSRDLNESLIQFGLAEPIVINLNNTIIGGHQRITALKAQNISEVDVMVPNRLLSPKEEKELNLRLNKNIGEWDLELLANFDEEFLKNVGFESKELDKIFRLDINPDADDVPAMRLKTNIKIGDMFQLGEHKLLCGDATKKEDVEKLMQGEKAELCLTDPPYGIGEKFGNYDDTIENLKNIVAQFLPLVKSISQRILLTPGNTHMFAYPKPDWVLAWFCSAGVGVNPWGFTCWNAILAYGNDPYLKNRKGSRPDAFILNEASEKLNHPTVKPISVWGWILERGSINRGEIILDPFGGSGTTLIACQNLNRKCRMMEISPEYCEVIATRFENFTGIKRIKL